MSASLRFTVLTPDRVLLAVDAATKVRVKLADDAWLSIYGNHAPLIAEIQPGPVQYDTAAESGEVAIAEGILQVSAGLVTILTSGYERGTPAPEATSGDEDQTFDRLAKQLLMSLGAKPADSRLSLEGPPSSDGGPSGDGG